MNPNDRFLTYAIKIGAIEFIREGRPLKSGRISPYFFNSGLFKTGASLLELANAYAAVARHNFQFEVVYGPAYKGIPLAAIVAMAIGGDVEYAYNRKEVKDHGEGGLIVGASLRDKRVLIVDDVMTSGSSSKQAVEIIQAHGGIIAGCVIAFDRQERGVDTQLSAVQEFQKNHDIPVHAVATLDDLLSLLKQEPGETEETIHQIEEYRSKYGV